VAQADREARAEEQQAVERLCLGHELGAAAAVQKEGMHDDLVPQDVVSRKTAPRRRRATARGEQSIIAAAGAIL